MSLLDELIVKFDEATGFYDKAKALDSHIKGGNVWEDILSSGRGTIDAVTSFVSNPWKILKTAVNPLAGVKDLGWEIVESILFPKTSSGDIPEWEKKEPPLNYTPPRPSSLDPNWNPHGGNPEPIRKGKKPRPKVPDRKLKPKNTSPGFRSTEKTEAITALTQISERNWGELICYPVQNVGTVRYVYETVAETTGVSDGVASKSLSEWLALQIIPGDSAEKDAEKQQLGYFTANWNRSCHVCKPQKPCLDLIW
jgi:hypothetical protein